jgi:DNA adenine methylase
MQQVTPPLKWAGGKRWLVPFIQHAWNENRDLRLVEPFCGGLSVTIGLLPERALLNDINPYLINFYLWLRRGLEINIDMKNSSPLYYRYRDEFNRLIANGYKKDSKAAQLFYYLNKTGFNGLCRFNRQGKYNVPFGKHTTINYSTNLKQYKSLFSCWEFKAGSYLDLKINDDDFIYADPPYDVEFRDYTKHGFDWKDQVELVDWLSNHNGPIILSNAATERIVNLYKVSEYRLHFLQEKIKINATGRRISANVVIATRNIEIKIAQETTNRAKN